MTAQEIREQEYQENSERGYSNKTRGMNFELKVHRTERKNSILSIHSDGSYGRIDEISLRKDYVLLIVCKANGYIEPKERRELDKLKEDLSRCSYKCRIQIRYRVGRKTRKMWY